MRGKRIKPNSAMDVKMAAGVKLSGCTAGGRGKGGGAEGRGRGRVRGCERGLRTAAAAAAG
jgi:hypothetical protein